MLVFLSSLRFSHVAQAASTGMTSAKQRNLYSFGSLAASNLSIRLALSLIADLATVLSLLMYSFVGLRVGHRFLVGIVLSDGPLRWEWLLPPLLGKRQSYVIPA